MLPKVAIIYLTYPTKNWEADINRCLASLERMTYPKERVELICVESKGKIPPVKPWFDERWLPKSGKELPRITYVFRDEWIGFSGNNNLGLEEAKRMGCEFVYLLNEDTDTDPDFLIRSVECAQQDSSIACVQSMVLLGEERKLINSSGNAYHYLGFGYSNNYQCDVSRFTFPAYRTGRHVSRTEIGYASGAGVLVRLAALQDEKLFDEKFYSYHEDTDLCLRLRMRGWRTVTEPTSVIWHYYEFGKAKINYYYMERNRYVLVFSYYRPWTLFILMPMLLVMDIGVLGFAMMGGWADMKWKVYRDFCSSDFWRWIAARRSRIQKSRTISDRTFLRVAVSAIAFQEVNVKNPMLTWMGNPLLRAYWFVARMLI